MTINNTPDVSSSYAALRTFVRSFLPSNVEVIRGQQNRTPPPKGTDYVVMQAIRREKLSTPIDTFFDTRFIGSIAGNVLTVTEFDYGLLKVGSVILGGGMQPNTYITNMPPPASGTVGVYQVTPLQTLSSRVMAAGVLDALGKIELTVQLDVHGPNSDDYAHRIHTLLRDDYAWLNFTRNPAAAGVYPLTCDNPKQIPYIDDSNQVETRWVVDACLQLNASVNDIPQEFFEHIVVGLIDVDTKYPAQ